MGLSAMSTPALSEHVEDRRRTAKSRNVVDLGFQDTGDDSIHFRRHTLDLGISEAVAIADINKDAKLHIVSGQYWYEQVPLEPGIGPRFIHTR